MASRYEHAYVVNVVSDDHPGIVASVGRAVDEFDGNIDACSQTVLRGYFTLIMVVSIPEPIAPGDLREAIRRQDVGGSDLDVIVRAYAPRPATSVGDSDRFVVTAFGSDTPGVVLQFSRYLAGRDINIVDLYGQRHGDQFVLVSQVDIPARLDLGMLQADLADLGARNGFTVRLQHENIFVATNQLRLRGDALSADHAARTPWASE